MTYLNKPALNTLKVGLFTALSFLVACGDNDTKKPSAGGGASFIIDPKETVEADFAPVDTSSDNGYNYRKILSLKICLKDIAETKTIAKTDFKVIAGDLSSVKTTDSYGCFIWKELIEFDPVDNDKTVFMSRKIEAIGKHTGAVDFEYSVNPSQPKGKVVIYPGQNENAEYSKSNSVLYRPQGVVKSSNKNYFYDVLVNIAGSGEAKIGTQSAGTGESGGSVNPGIYNRRTAVSDLVLNYKQIDYANIGVDRNLNLTLPYNYYTELSVSLIKQNSSQVAEEKLRKGNFLFHLIFSKTTSSGRLPRAEEIYSVVRFVGQPRGDSGLIRQEIVLNFENIPALSNRMSVFLTITSQDTPSLFADQTFEGVVDGIAANKKLTITMNPSEISARNIFADYTVHKANKQKVELDVAESLKAEGVWPITSSRVSFSRTNKESATVDLEKLVRDLNDGQTLSAVELESFCKVVFHDHASSSETINSVYHKCLKSPKDVLVAEIREYVSSLKSILGTPRFNTLEKFTLTSKVNVDHANESSVGYNWGAKVSGQAEAGVEFGNDKKDGKLSEFFKWKILKPVLGTFGYPLAWLMANTAKGFKYNLNGKVMLAGEYAKESSSKSTQREESNLEGLTTETLFAQQITVDMDVEVKKCLLLSVNSGTEEKLAKTSFSAQRFFCVEGVREKRSESYYLVQQIKNTESNTLIDPNSAESNPLKMMIRGSGLYSSFMSLVKNKTVIGWLPAGTNSEQMSSLLTEEAPLLLSSGHKVIIPNDK